MVNHNDELEINPESDPEDITEGKITYEDLATEEPEREEDLVGEYTGGSFTEEEEAGGNVSDFKALLKELSPDFGDEDMNALLKPAMVSRIFPDNFLDKFGLLATRLVMQQDTNEVFDFIKMISNLQDGLSIGYEGRGIGDRLEAFGSVKDDEIDKISKDLGL